MRKDNHLLKAARRGAPRITPRHRDYTIPPRIERQEPVRTGQGAKQ